MYCRAERPRVCPWCIADGSAAEKWQADFVAGTSDGSRPVVQRVDWRARLKWRVARLKKSVFGAPAINERRYDDELHNRTPGFSSFQEQDWQLHCGEPCEFHGLATSADFRRMTDAGKERLFANSGLDESEFAYIANESDAVPQEYYLKFVCRKCGEIVLVEDLD